MWLVPSFYLSNSQCDSLIIGKTFRYFLWIASFFVLEIICLCFAIFRLFIMSLCVPWPRITLFNVLLCSDMNSLYFSKKQIQLFHKGDLLEGFDNLCKYPRLLISPQVQPAECETYSVCYAMCRPYWHYKHCGLKGYSHQHGCSEVSLIIVVAPRRNYEEKQLWSNLNTSFSTFPLIFGTFR